MTTTTDRVEVELIFEPEHYSVVCGCTIPAAWTALVFEDGEQLPKWPCGHTREQAEENVRKEYPEAKIS